MPIHEQQSNKHNEQEKSPSLRRILSNGIESTETAERLGFKIMRDKGSIGNWDEAERTAVLRKMDKLKKEGNNVMFGRTFDDELFCYKVKKID
ncbi:MAG: hypothetical protein ABIH87_02155 [bacterium]